MRRLITRLFSGVVLAAALTLPAAAQTTYGSIVGTVTDQSGAALAGATVNLTNTRTGERRTADAGPDGGYRFVNLIPGTYRIDIEKTGFKHLTRDSILVEVEAAVRFEAVMELGEVSQTTTVTAEAPLMQTENATLSQVVAARTVNEMPLNGRNVLNLVALVPGVVPQGGSMSNLTSQNIFSAGNFQIGGGTANQSATYLDGAPVNVNYGNLTALVPTQDSIGEFRVQTSNNSAEYGRYTGGVVNLSSKSGSNEFHGTAYEFLRNRALNAGTFFANRTGAGKPAFTQNQFGADAAGPVKKDKVFFFFGYEGFRLRQGLLFLNTVPTVAQRTGDFSNFRNAAGAQVPIYDPLTTCGTLNNPACDPTSTVTRSPFPNNVIPATRIDPVAKNLKDRIYGLPNVQGTQNTNLFNFSKNASYGGGNDQFNLRNDFNLSDKQRLFARWTRWTLSNLARDPYQNGYYFNGAPPESFTTNQIVLADTYTFTPTTIGDLRLAFLRFRYDRVPGSLGMDMTTLGLPSYYKALEFPALPVIVATGYNEGREQFIQDRNNSYSIVPSLTKIMGRHTMKFGGEVRKVDFNFVQINNSGGFYSFDNLFTSRNALNPGSTGDSFASFLLGTAASGNLPFPNLTASSMRYQGYYVNDSFQVSSKLTLTAGLRWEIPGVWTERYDRLSVFNPALANPLAQATGLPLKGEFVLVNTPQHPSRGLKDEHFKLFAPRLGLAYRLSDKTVIRAGAGIFYIPADAAFVESPYQNAINSYSNVMISTVDNSVTPVSLLSNPFPTGLIKAPGRDPGFQSQLLGGSFGSTSGGLPSAIINNNRYGYTSQWNFTVQRQLPQGIAVEAAYAGLRGVHLPNTNMQLNQLPDQYLPLGSQLVQQVSNPFYGLIANGPLSTKTVQRAQLLRPFPEYQAVIDAGGYVGNSTYNSLQLKGEKRFSSGGTILASYTFSKILGDTETGTPWLEAGAVAPIQDFNNLKLEKSLSSFDSRQRFSLSYVLDLPVGRGKKFLSNVTGAADKLVSGWGFNGVTTFQEGFPLGFTAVPNLTQSQGGGLRPNVVAGCDKNIGGSAQSRLNQWFNTACFSVPGPYTFGTESRTDPVIRGDGINNFDFALFKRTQIAERYGLEFRTEVFNLFNRVQFGNPNLIETTAANSQFGIVSTQVNNQRLIQLALRLRF